MPLKPHKKKSHKKGGVGFKDVPEGKKFASKEEEERHKQFESQRKSHYKNEYIKLKERPPPADDDDDDDDDMSSQGVGSSSRK